MKINLGVFFGGKSTEHEVSIITAIQAIENMNREKYNVIPVYISKENKMYCGKLVDKIEEYKNIDNVIKNSKEVVLVQKNNKVYLIDPNLSFKEKMKYINTFVFRAFLISVFLVFIIFVLFMFIYFGDLLFNVKQGKYKNPIYSAYIIVSGSMVPTININDTIQKRKLI